MRSRVHRHSPWRRSHPCPKDPRDKGTPGRLDEQYGRGKSGSRRRGRLAALRADREERERKRGKEPLGSKAEGGEAEKEEEESESRHKKKKKKKDKAKKKKRKKLKMDLKKEVKVLLAKTGADPDPEFRKKVRKKASKLARKKRSSSGSGSGSSSGSGTGESLADRSMFGQSSRVKLIGARYPRSFVSVSRGGCCRGSPDLGRRRMGPGEPTVASDSFVHSVLQTDASASHDASYGARSYDPVSHRGPCTSRPDRSIAGRCLAEIEKSGNDGPWQPLLHRTASGTGGQRSDFPSLHTRVQGSGQTSTGGRQGAGGVHKTIWKPSWTTTQKRGLGKDWRQERRRKGKRQQERLQEGRQGEARGKQGSEERGLRATSRREDQDKGVKQDERERGGGRTAPCPPPDQGTGGLRPLDEWNGRPPNVNVLPAEMQAEAEENSKMSAMTDRQDMFHKEAEVEIFPTLAGCSFAELGSHINYTLQSLCWERSDKTMTMDQDICYPFPLGVYPNVPSSQQPWLDAVLRGLNSLYGTGMCTRDQPTEVQKKMVEGLLPFIERMTSWTEKVPHEDLKSLFSVKGVDYRGEEVKLARSFTWEMVEGALPSGVGTLDLAAFCTSGCRFFVEKFERFLVAPELQQLGRPPRVMVADEHWEAVAGGLISKGICGVMPRSQLYHVGTEPLLNGMFAVSKNEYVQGIEQHRVIMNLVPLNRLCQTLKGDVNTLPTIAGLSAFYLEEGEVAILCSEDIKCFYYLFQVPEGWRKFMGFAKELPESLVPLEMRGEPCHLVSLVLPMGWANSVGLAQHVHRNVLRWTMEDQGLQGEGELCRDRPPTRSKDMFRIYLSNPKSRCLSCSRYRGGAFTSAETS